MRDFLPQTRDFNERGVTRPQGDLPNAPSFVGGVFNDLPLTNIPTNGLFWAENYRVYKERIEARTGCKEWSTLTLPSLSGRTGYSVTKSGTTVTKTAGTDFSPEDIGNFIVYDDGKREKITSYTDPDTVVVEKSTAHAASTAAYITGPENGVKQHRKTKRVILHVGYKIYWANASLDSWTEIPGHIGRIGNSISKMIEHDDAMYIGNKEGIFKIDMSSEPYVYWKINSAAPKNLITETAESSTNTFVYKYIVKLSRISTGSNLRTRFGDYNSSGTKIKSVRILQESAPFEFDSDGKDYAKIVSSNRVGEAGTYFGRLTCSALSSPYDVPGGWDSITDGQFKITIDGTENNIECDFSGVTSMPQIAEIIQLALRGEYPDSAVTCKYDTDHFVIESPLEGGTITVCSAGDSNDISSAMGGDAGTASNAVEYSTPISVGNIWVPRDKNIGYYSSHWTHYSIYRTLDFGDEGSNPYTGIGNNEEFFVWLGDIPIAKSFMASVAGNVISASDGVFQKCDEGCTFEFADGTTVVLSTYIDSKSMNITTTTTVASQAGAIGNGRVMQASQSGATVTRTAGAIFYESDVGKTLYWPNGLTTLITGYTSANVVTGTSANVSSTGAIVDPTYRKYYDTTRDEYRKSDISIKYLRARMSQSVYWLFDRFSQPLPDSEEIEIVDLFFFTAQRGQQIVNYCAMPEYKSYLIGSYNADTQYMSFDDKAQILSSLPGTLCIFCSNSTHVAPTNTYSVVEDKNTGTMSFSIETKYTKSHEIGAIDYGAIVKCNIEDKPYILLRNSDNAWRYFDGNTYSGDITKDRIKKKMAQLDVYSTAAYHPSKGYYIWSKSGKDTSTEESNNIRRWYDQYDADALYRDQYRDNFVKRDSYAL